MNLPNKTAADLLCKDRNRATNAATKILSLPDVEAWKCLIEHDEFIFDFIKDKAGKLLIKEYKQEYFNNILELMNEYAPSWDECITAIIEKSTNEDTEQQILELLYEGSDAQQSYCAKFFVNNPNPMAQEALFETAKTAEYELKLNCAEALGILKYSPAYDYYVENLKSDDDWEILDAAEFLASYGDTNAVLPMLEAMEKSSMSEQIAGEVANLTQIFEYFDNENQEIALKSLECFDYIISGLGEIWSLSIIFNFNIYECTQRLIELAKEPNYPLKSKLSQVLLKLKAQISLFMENKEYSYDEDKSVLAELEEIFAQLQGEDDEFWQNQANIIVKELEEKNTKRQLSAISTINEIDLKSASQEILNQIENSDNEVVLSELVLCLNKFGELDKINDKSVVLNKIKDENLLALVKNLFE